MDKQKFLVIARTKELYDRAMYHIYLKDIGKITYVYSLNSEEFMDKFMHDKDESQIEFTISSELISKDMEIMDKRVRIFNYRKRVSDSLVEMVSWVVENASPITKTPIFERARQVLKRIDEQPKEIN